jgi:hypothetical protein
MTDNEIREMLQKIFPPKPEAIPSELPPEMREVLDIARDFGLENIPPIVIGDHDIVQNSRVDFNAYAHTTIVISRRYVDCRERTNSQMARSLAHELGHWDHIMRGKGTYETFGFKNCEDWADDYRDRVMNRTSFEMTENAFGSSKLPGSQSIF